MIKVYVTKQSHYPISAPKIKKSLSEFFKKEGIVSDAQVSVAIVGEAKMKELAKKYLKEKGVVHDVLSFTESEVGKGFLYPADDTIHLGEIILCYPKIIEEAKEEGKRIDVKTQELVEHSALHLLGKHHE